MGFSSLPCQTPRFPLNVACPFSGFRNGLSGAPIQGQEFSRVRGYAPSRLFVTNYAHCVPGGRTFALGGTTYTSDPGNPITGTGKLDFMKAAPTAMFGFGNLVPQHRYFTYNFELGALFQGSARTKLNLTGNACDSTGLNCVNAATDPTVQQNVAAEQTKINNKLSPFKYYPVISFGFGYRF